MLDEVVAKLVDAQFQPRARVVGAKGRMPTAVSMPSSFFRTAWSSVMKKNLSAEQWSLYEAETQKRDENRKRMTIRYFVDAIDRELYLTPDQCEQLEAALKEQLGAALDAVSGEPPLWQPVLSDDDRPAGDADLERRPEEGVGGVQKVGVYWGFAGMLAGFANDADGLEVELGEPARPDRSAECR